MKVKVNISHTVISDSLPSHGLKPDPLLCPWNSPGMSTAMGCHFLLQGIFPTWESNPGLPHSRQILYQLRRKWQPTPVSLPGKSRGWRNHGVPKCQTRLETSLSLSLPSEPLGKPQGLPFSRRSSWPRDRAQFPRIAGGFFIIWVTREVFSLLMENLLSEWKSLSHVWLFATPWTIQSMEFSRPEYWSVEPFPSPGNLSNPGIKPRSPTLKANSLPSEPQEKPMRAFYVKKCIDKYGKFSTIRQLTPTGKRGNVPKH